MTADATSREPWDDELGLQLASVVLLWYRTQRRCGWALTDEDGLSHPCDDAASAELVDAPELWEGFYCWAHAWKAREGARREIREDWSELVPLDSAGPAGE